MAKTNKCTVPLGCNKMFSKAVAFALILFSFMLSGNQTVAETTVPTAPGPILSVSISGTGAGTISGDISCSSFVSCTPKTYLPGTSANLLATPNAFSTFSGWSGDKTSTEKSFTFTMDSPKVLVATFTAAPKAKIESIGYTSFAKAYTAASGSPTTVMLLEDTLPIDSAVIDKPLVLSGGYLPDFSRSTSGYTTLNGKLAIRSGNLVADRIAVAPSTNTATLASITVSPTNPSLTGGAKLQFLATGTYSDGSTIDFVSSVVWNIVENGGGNISSDGMYTAPTTPGTYHITATNVDDSSKSYSVAVIVNTASVTRLLGGAIQGNTLNPSGIVSTMNISSGMYSGITTDGNYLYFTNMHSICKADISTGVISIVAGSVEDSGSSDGIGVDASFNYPYDLTTDGTNLYVVDSLNNTIRKIVISTGVVTTFAGNASARDYVDGIGIDARFNEPEGITTDGTNLYVADYGNGTIRKIEISTAKVTTIAGKAGSAGSVDGRGTAAIFKSLGGITTDGINLYVTESGDFVGGSYVPSGAIRKIVIDTGDVVTIAGSGNETGSDDGIGKLARFSQPIGITTDGTNLFIVDRTNYTIRKFDISTGAVTTIAGTARVQGTEDGDKTTATFYYPTGITTDGKKLFVTDGGISTGIIRIIQ